MTASGEHTSPAHGPGHNPSPPEPETSPAPRHARTVRGASTLARDFAAIAGGNFGNAVLALVTVLLTTRMLSPAAYGTVATALIVANLIYSVSTTWTQPALRRYGREDLELRGSMSRLTWDRALITVPLAAISIALTVALKRLGVLPHDLTWTFVALIVLTSGGLIMIDHFQSLLETSGRMRTSAIGQLLRQVVYIAALAVVFFSQRHSTPQLLMGLSFASMAVLVIGWLPLVWRWGIVPVEFNKALLRRMLWLSTPVIALTASQYVIASVDVIVLRTFTNPATVGVYAVAYQAYSVMRAAAQAAPAVFLPLFVSLRLAGRGDLVVRYLKSALPQLTFVLSAVFGIGAALLPLAVPIVFGHAFAAAAHPLAILFVALLLVFETFMLTPILLLHEQTRRTAIISIGGAVINVVGDVVTVGVLDMGVLGPAISTSVALGFMFLAYHALAGRLEGVSSRLDLMLVGPLFAGVLPALLLPGFSAAAVGTLAVVAVSALVLVWRRPVHREDAELFAKLDLPAPLKHAITRGIAIVGRP